MDIVEFKNILLDGLLFSGPFLLGLLFSGTSYH